MKLALNALIFSFLSVMVSAEIIKVDKNLVSLPVDTKATTADSAPMLHCESDNYLEFYKTCFDYGGFKNPDYSKVNKGFILTHKKETDKTVLLVHGIGDSPYYMRDLGAVFHMNGYNVVAIRLSGHGTDEEHLKLFNNDQWIKDVRFGIDLAKKYGDKLSVASLSVGSSLVLQELSESHEDFEEMFMFSPVLKNASVMQDVLCRTNTIDVLFDDMDTDTMGVHNVSYCKIPRKTLCESMQLSDLILTRQQILKEQLPALMMAVYTEDERADVHTSIEFFSNNAKEGSKLLVYTDEGDEGKWERILKVRYELTPDQYKIAGSNHKLSHRTTVSRGSGIHTGEEFNYTIWSNHFRPMFREFIKNSKSSETVVE